MDIQIKGHHVEITDALRDKIEEKLEHLHKYDEADLINIEVILTVEKERQKASATANMRNSKSLHAEATTDDMYESIDKLEAKLKTLITEHHKKQIDKRKQGKSRRESN